MRTVRNFSVRLATIRFFPRASPTYRWRVSAYEDLDAFKACHQLTLAVHRLAEKLEERDATLSGHLWAAALCASSRIARGSAFRNRRMFAMRSEEHTFELQSPLNISYAVFCLKKKTPWTPTTSPKVAIAPSPSSLTTTAS